MEEKPIVIKTETNLDASEQRAQRLKALQDKYRQMLREKGYPYLYKK